MGEHECYALSRLVCVVASEEGDEGATAGVGDAGATTGERREGVLVQGAGGTRAREAAAR